MEPNIILLYEKELRTRNSNLEYSPVKRCKYWTMGGPKKLLKRIRVQTSSSLIEKEEILANFHGKK